MNTSRIRELADRSLESALAESMGDNTIAETNVSTRILKSGTVEVKQVFTLAKGATFES